MTYAQKKKSEIFQEIKKGKCTIQKVEQTAKQISRVACRSKLKYYSMDEAASKIYRYPIDVEPYLCECGAIHFGHPSAWKKEATRIIIAKEEARKRNSGVQTPQWKLDPRRKFD
jgi:hypothetical protein